MYYANEHEIEDWAHRYGTHPILGCAARTLLSLVHAVNSCSDGWPYWQAPRKASANLVQILYEADRTRRRGETPRPTEVDLRAAYKTIKAFHTRYGDKYGFSVDLHFPEPREPKPAHQPLTLFA